MGTAQAAYDWATSQLGMEESGGPSGHDGNIIVYWDDIHHHEEQGQPWCAAFFEDALEKTGTTPVQLLPGNRDNQYCPTIMQQYKNEGKFHPIQEAQLGDQVFYNFGESSPPNHTGMVESIDPSGHWVTAIEGNTQPAAGGDQANGGGVYRRIRPWSLVMGVGRPNYDAPSTPINVLQTGDVEPMLALVPGGQPDAANRLPVWETNANGDMYAWNGAPGLQSLNQITTNHAAIVGMIALPDGSGVVLIGNDPSKDPATGEYTRSTYVIRK